MTSSDGRAEPICLVVPVQQLVQDVLQDPIMLIQQACIEHPISKPHGDQALHVRVWRGWSIPALSHEVRHILRQRMKTIININNALTYLSMYHIHSTMCFIISIH